MQQILRQFQFEGDVIACAPFGSGHINRTYRVACSGGREYILQRISRVAFRQPDALMENIETVTRFMAAQNGPLQTLRLISTKDGGTYCTDEEGQFWRAYDFVGGGVCLDMPRSTGDFLSGCAGLRPVSDDAQRLPRPYAP